MSTFVSATAGVGPTPIPSSFAEAYRDYAQRVARWVYGLGGPNIDAEDVAQDVFVVVSRKMSSFRGEGSFASWLFEITRKIVANHRRQLSRRCFPHGGESEVDNVPSQALDPAAELERRRLVVLFDRALDQLPEKYRTPFILYEIDDMSIQAIAELCTMNPSTVKVRLARARARFTHAYQRLLGKEASSRGTSLSKMAARAVPQAPSIAPQLGAQKR